MVVTEAIGVSEACLDLLLAYQHDVLASSLGNSEPSTPSFFNAPFINLIYIYLFCAHEEVRGQLCKNLAPISPKWFLEIKLSSQGVVGSTTNY